MIKANELRISNWVTYNKKTTLAERVSDLKRLPIENYLLNPTISEITNRFKKELLKKILSGQKK